MKKYFSSAICNKGYISTYHTIYKNDPSSKVFIANTCDDFERATFFNQLIKNFRGFNLELFNPFFDESPDGIYIENLNTYIISDSGYSKISPMLLGVWEKQINISDNKDYPLDLKREIITLKMKENNFYKKGCEHLKTASKTRERIHETISPYLNDRKVINFISRFCLRNFRDTKESGNGKMQLLTSPTPLGIHTHFDTLFDNIEKVIEIEDSWEFAGSVILGVLKDYAVREKIPFIVCPSYFGGDIPNTIIFPTASICVIVTDENRILPFEPYEKIYATRFLNSEYIECDEKVQSLLSAENTFLDKCVFSLFNGRDTRFKIADLTKGYCDSDVARESANNLYEKLIT